MNQSDGVLNRFNNESYDQSINQTNTTINEGDELIEEEGNQKRKYASYAVYKYCNSYDEALKGKIK